MDYQNGLATLSICVHGKIELETELHTLEFRLAKTVDQERVFGTSENTRSDLAQIVYSLNDLALRCSGVSFNELCRGVMPTTSSWPSSQNSAQHIIPKNRRQVSPLFKIQLTQIGNQKMEVRVLESVAGEPIGRASMPFGQEDLVALGDILVNANTAGSGLLQREVFVEHGLSSESKIASEYLVRLGKLLYATLLPGAVGIAFAHASNQVRQNRETLSLQLRFDDDATLAAQYPWELIHDGQRWVVASGTVEMTRYVTYQEAVTTAPVNLPARMLFVESRPRDLLKLPQNAESQVVWKALQPLVDNGNIDPKRLDKPTYNNLLEELSSSKYHMIHFDGHGIQAKRCQHCQSMNDTFQMLCHRCGISLEDTHAQAFLAFEDSEAKTDFVSTQAMENMFSTGGIRFVFLSACLGSNVPSGNVFEGMGPALIRAGVPAVVAMQYAVPVQATIDFSDSFYRAISRGESISRAVAAGRRRLFRDDTWFIPTLHLRTHDHEGRLFTV